jgi:hypothetical protein
MKVSDLNNYDHLRFNMTGVRPCEVCQCGSKDMYDLEGNLTHCYECGGASETYETIEVPVGVLLSYIQNIVKNGGIK